jgi:CRISPR-associated protein (TIGR02710 family)
VWKGIGPWHIFAVEEKKRASDFISTYQYDAAIATLTQSIGNLRPSEKDIWEGILIILKGYLAWDNFDHVNAVKNLSNGLKYMVRCENRGLKKSLQSYVEQVKENFKLLANMSNATSFFKKKHQLLTLDLVSNAKRRYEQGKYDDAVARLYRALEMVGQIAYKEATGGSNSDVDSDDLPESLREEYKKRYLDPQNGKIKLPLVATFRVLNTINIPLGEKFHELQKNLDGLIFTRNNSILAHGSQPIKKDTCEKFIELMRSHFVSEPLIEFPKLKL